MSSPRSSIRFVRPSAASSPRNRYLCTVYGADRQELQSLLGDRIVLASVRDGHAVVREGSTEQNERTIAALRERFGDYRVAIGRQDLARLLIEEARVRGTILALAESCTGGLVGARITSVSGSSAVFWGSIVSYADDAKVGLLGVSRQSLIRYGAVSEEVVREMAAGALRVSGAGVGLAVSGVAGPGGGTPVKPVGTVWLGCCNRAGEASTRRLMLTGGRNRVRRLAVCEALLMIRGFLWRVDR